MSGGISILIGIVLVIVGILFSGFFGLGRLPGDIVVSRPGFTFYFPITTMILVSIILTLLFWFFRK